MKKVTGLLLFLCIGHSGFSQLEKGRNLLNGTFNFIRETIIQRMQDTLGHDVFTTRSNSFGLNYGDFIKTNLAVGAGINYFHDQRNTMEVDGHSTHTLTTIRDETTAFTIAAFARYYTPAYKNKLALFLTASLFDIESSSLKDFSNRSYFYETKETNSGLRFSPGITYFATRWLAFEVTAGYLNFARVVSKTYDTPATLPNSSIKSWMATSGLFSLTGVTFGISFYFGRPKKAQAPEEKKAN